MTTELRPNDDMPSERQLGMALGDFRVWVAKREGPPDGAPRIRLAEVVGMSRQSFYGICDSGQMWNAGPRSPYWAWRQRRSALWAMDGAAIVRLSNEFRAVSVALKQPLSAVGQSWWDNGDYSGLGLAVRGSGSDVQIFRLGPDGEIDTWDPRPVDGLADGSQTEDEQSESGSDEPDDALVERGDEVSGAVADDTAEEIVDEVVEEVVEERGSGDVAVAAGADDAGADDVAVDDATADEAADEVDEDDAVAEAETDEGGVGDDDTVYGLATDSFLPVGEPVDDALGRLSAEIRDDISNHLLLVSSVEQVARICGAPVIALVPGLSLEVARKAALLRINGWHPAYPRKDAEGKIEEYRVRWVEGLWGDALHMLYYSEEVDYADDGARLVAFAPTLAWGVDERLPYSAQQMRAGVTISERQRKHAVSDHDGRPDLIGLRPSDWAPIRRYPDSDWFFGSEGILHHGMLRHLIELGLFYKNDYERFVRAAEIDIRLLPLVIRGSSRAELLEHWYLVREVADAFVKVDGFKNSVFALELERMRLIIERTMLSDEYAITPYYHGKGKRLARSTRISERRWMLERVRDIVLEARRARGRQKVRRFFNSLFLGPFRWMRRRVYIGRYRALRARGIFPGKEGDLSIETQEYKAVRGGIGIEKKEGFDWNAHEALRQVPAEQRYGSLDPATFCGLDYTKWGAQVVSVASFDRRRWYTLIDDPRVPVVPDDAVSDDAVSDDVVSDDVVPDVSSEDEVAEVGVVHEDDGVEEVLPEDGLLEDAVGDGVVSDDFMPDKEEEDADAEDDEDEEDSELAEAAVGEDVVSDAAAKDDSETKDAVTNEEAANDSEASERA